MSSSSSAVKDPAKDLPPERLRDLHLCSAASVGHLPEVVSLVTAGANVNARNERLLTPLMLSVENEHCAAVTKFLLEHGADARARTEDLALTPLHIACKNANIPAVRLLLRYDADVLALDCTRRSVLHWAAVKGPTSLMVKLIRRTKGSLVNEADDSGYTPLMMAAEHGRASTVQVLLAAGADSTTRNKLNHNAVELADWFGHKLVVDLLDVHAKVAGLVSKPALVAPVATEASPVADASASKDGAA